MAQKRKKAETLENLTKQLVDVDREVCNCRRGDTMPLHPPPRARPSPRTSDPEHNDQLVLLAVSIDETNKLGDGQFNRTTEPDGPAQECVQPLRGQCGPYGPVLIATPSSPTEGAREFDQHPWMRPDGQQ